MRFADAASLKAETASPASILQNCLFRLPQLAIGRSCDYPLQARFVFEIRQFGTG